MSGSAVPKARITIAQRIHILFSPQDSWLRARLLAHLSGGERMPFASPVFAEPVAIGWRLRASSPLASTACPKLSE
jgi:hypothetical protein